jgi:hypothetical protein
MLSDALIISLDFSSMLEEGGAALSSLKNSEAQSMARVAA